MYDLEDMKAECFDGEELAVRILGDSDIGGFTHIKAMKRELAENILFDESLFDLEDLNWLINILNHNKNVKVYRMNYFLYCYVQHENFGITRELSRCFFPNGMSRAIEAIEKVLEFENLSPVVANAAKGSIYDFAVSTLWNNIQLADDAKKEIKYYMKRYSYIYYFNSGHTTISKIKTIIKKVLMLLGIHKRKKYTLP